MDEIERLLIAYRSKGVLLDSNLLLVYVVGLWDVNQIGRFKRTASFSVDDFHLLLKLARFFRNIVTTPNILSEVNSLSNQLAEHSKASYYPTFLKQIQVMDEHYVPSLQAVSATTFERFGLTDAAIAGLTRNRYLVLTDDLRLSVHLQTLGNDVVNFNHLRFLNWE